MSIARTNFIRNILILSLIGILTIAAFFSLAPLIKHYNFTRFLDKVQSNILNNAVLSLGAKYEGEPDNFLEYNFNKRIHPGSNFKLFTAAAALSYLKSDFTFKTQLSLSKDRTGKIHLMLNGSGDPTLRKKDFEEFIQPLKLAGKITGNLHYNDRYFSGEKFGPGWGHDWKNQYFAVPITGLQLNDNLLDIRKVKDEKTGVTEITTSPLENYQPLQDEVTYYDEAPDKELKDITASMDENGKVTVRGETLASVPFFMTSATVANPSVFTAMVFKQEMVRLAAVKSDIKVVRAESESGAENLGVIYEHRSNPLKDIVTTMLKFSKNNYAESLVRTLGKEVRGEGTQANGVSVLREFFNTIGIPEWEMSAFDGSGLSPSTRVSSNAILKLFEYVNKQPWKDIFWNALPQSQVDGTLKHRFAEAGLQNPVIAKTGTHEFSSSLSGKIVRAGEKNILFTIHIYNHPFPVEEIATKVHPLIDRIVALLDRQF